jgi:eukaryotic-like serine/threonine-protein kinase
MSGAGSRGGGSPPPGSGDADRTLRVDLSRRSASAGGGGGFRPGVLAAGDLLAGRFRIVAFLGQGGMGEVYEAEDTDLGGQVAIKTVRPEIASEEMILERFRREINLARRVTHPNVCRIFDLWHHRPAVDGGPPFDITFLTMELLGGETLAEQLERDGRMAPAAALPIVLQVATALTAAHQAGVVHRDFKSANVMLAPQEEGGTRAVVTDFGLARAATGSEPIGASLTGAGRIVGSPSYMAPEQVSGGEVDARADLYAFGVVIYEMVTGRLPFVGDSALSTAVKRLSEPPPPPRRLVPDLEPRWEAVILRCLERDPADRFANPQEVAAALAGGTVAASPRLRRRRWRRWGLAAAAVVVAAALALGLPRLLRRSPEGRPAGPVSDRPAVAVLSFHNLAGSAEAAWLATALPELVSADLAGGSAIRLVPRETVTRSEVDLGLAAAGTLAPEALERLRKLLGSDYLVLGSYLLGGAGGLRVDVSLERAAGAETRATASERGSEEELATVAAHLADRLRAALGVPASRSAPAVQLATGEATRAYAEGLARLRLFDARGAQEHLQRAVTADPSSPFAHAALAAAWKALGYDQRAETEAGRAFELAAGLSWEQRQLLEGRFRAAARRWPEAITIYSNLWSVFPDNLEYGLALAEAQTAGGEGAAALTTVEQLRKLAGKGEQDPRIDLAEAEAARSQADYDRQLQAARRAVAEGEALGARLLVAQGRLLEGSVLEQQGDFEGAKDAYRQATRLYGDAGDRVGEARALHSIGIVLARQGNLAGARDLWQEVLATYREAGSRADEARALSNLGSIARLQGDFEEASRLHGQALAISREIHDRQGEARDLSNLAVVVKQQGDLDGAIDRYREVLAIWREIGGRSQTALTQNNLANVLLEQGHLAEAKGLYESALALFEEIGERPSAAAAMSNLGRIAKSQGDFAEAETLHGKALAAYREMGATQGIATELVSLAELAHLRGDLTKAEEQYRESLTLLEQAGARPQALGVQLGLAGLLLDAGRPAEAVTPARAAAAGFATAGDGPDQGLALAALAQAEADSGRLADARTTAAKAARLLPDSVAPDRRLPALLALARVTAAGGDSAAARSAIEKVLAAAREVHLEETELEALLALGEVEAAAGASAPGSGRARLAALEGTARAKGYELIARRAARARQGGG